MEGKGPIKAPHLFLDQLGKSGDGLPLHAVALPIPRAVQSGAVVTSVFVIDVVGDGIQNAPTVARRRTRSLVVAFHQLTQPAVLATSGVDVFQKVIFLDVHQHVVGDQIVEELDRCLLIELDLEQLVRELALFDNLIIRNFDHVASRIEVESTHVRLTILCLSRRVQRPSKGVVANNPNRSGANLDGRTQPMGKAEQQIALRQITLVASGELRGQFGKGPNDLSIEQRTSRVHLSVAGVAEVLEELKRFFVLGRRPLFAAVRQDRIVSRANQSVSTRMVGLHLSILGVFQVSIERVLVHRPVEVGSLHHFDRADVGIDLLAKAVPRNIPGISHRSATVNNFKFMSHFILLASVKTSRPTGYLLYTPFRVGLKAPFLLISFHYFGLYLPPECRDNRRTATSTRSIKAQEGLMANEVTSPKKTDVADADMGFEAYAGGGMENVSETDVLIPRLTILQGLSPQLNKKKSEYIEDAKIGHICDVGTKSIFETVLFLPVYFNKVYLEWAPRESDAGLISIHDTPDVLKRLVRETERGMVTAEGNSIIETDQFFGFNLSDNAQKCFISFSSTQMKKARMWNTLAMKEKVKRADGSEFTPPLWYRTYKLGTASEGNNKGEWEGWTIDRGPKLMEVEGYNAKDLFDRSVSFHKALVEGQARADQSDIASDGPVSDDEVAF